MFPANLLIRDVPILLSLSVNVLSSWSPSKTFAVGSLTGLFDVSISVEIKPGLKDLKEDESLINYLKKH